MKRLIMFLLCLIVIIVFTACNSHSAKEVNNGSIASNENYKVNNTGLIDDVKSEFASYAIGRPKGWIETKSDLGNFYQSQAGSMTFFTSGFTKGNNIGMTSKPKEVSRACEENLMAIVRANNIYYSENVERTIESSTSIKVNNYEIIKQNGEIKNTVTGYLEYYVAYYTMFTSTDNETYPIYWAAMSKSLSDKEAIELYVDAAARTLQ